LVEEDQHNGFVDFGRGWQGLTLDCRIVDIEFGIDNRPRIFNARGGILCLNRERGDRQFAVWIGK
jgi:hypothetical protein